LRRVLCRICLDWSERRAHLAGSLGQGMLSWMLDNSRADREPDSRVIRFTPYGCAQFQTQFPTAMPFPA